MPRKPEKVRGLLCIDFETGGVDNKTGNHAALVPAVEFAGVGLDGVSLEVVQGPSGAVSYDTVIQPYDEQLVWQEGAVALHGLTKARCQAEGIPLRQVMQDFVQLATETNRHNSRTAKPCLLGHNVGFDLNFLTDLARRTGVDLSRYLAGHFDCFGNFQPMYVETVQLVEALWGDLADETPKFFTLGRCCQRAGIDLVDGHRAMNDVVATCDLYRYLTARLRATGGAAVSVVEGQVTTQHRRVFEW